jgi:predicted transposase/invertase (TIGR01784 family)
MIFEDYKEDYKYVNPFTDFGFKKIFGEEANKDLLIDFLNELLREEGDEIKDLTFIKNEHLGASDLDRKAIFDLYCVNERGEKFIVELQKTKQNFFKDRTVYYSTFPIVEQAKRGEWNYELKKVYTIAILDFVFNEDKKERDKYLYRVKLSDIETNKVFYDKLTFIYIEMPKFSKNIDELESHFEKWLYLLRHLATFREIPVKLQERIFKRVFGIAELACFSREQMQAYEDSLKYYRDLKNSLDTAHDDGYKEGKMEGIKEGRHQEKIEIAKNLLDLLDDKTISDKTGLSIDEVNDLRND